MKNISLHTLNKSRKIFLTLRLAWEATLKNTKVKLDVVTNINMLLMAEKFVKGGICHANYQYAKAHNKYMKNYDKIKELSEM